MAAVSSAGLHARVPTPVANHLASFGPKSPFVASPNPFLRPEAEPEQLSPVDAEAPPAESIEVTVLWGSTVLSTVQLAPPRGYAVGEVGGRGGVGTTVEGDVDFALSSERLGAARRELVVLRAGAPFVMLAAGETPRVFERGRAVDPGSALVDCSDVSPGARGIELRRDRVLILEASGVTFRFAGGDEPESVPRALLSGTDRSALTTLGTAAILQGLLVAALAYLTPSMAWGDEGDLDRDRLQLMQQYLHASAEHERAEEPRPSEPGAGEKGTPAERHAGPEGASGKPTATQAGRRAIAGKTEERALSRAELIAEARDYGTIGLLNVLNASSAPNSPWGAELATGPDSVNALGDLFSQNIGEGRGSGGVGLSGTGLGGGGIGAGVGLGHIGTCLGIDCGGFGASVGRTGRGHAVSGPSVRMATGVGISGRLPPEVIQRTVRQNFGRFRACYEGGLRSNPNLEGRVVARFVIGRDGAVSNVSAGGDLPDAQVRSCVASAFYGLSFPTPESGIVTVSYPILLTPG